ncbi:MAG TPA: NAD(P)-dependent alcohol dehydrogenase [Xanthomonadales bacterium]|nr:NAD(P)-dependent alcohol dehydrogenase [Xanthomonadales bacterium]
MPENKAVVMHEPGLENLNWENQALVSPGPNDIALRMSAFSINWRDLATISGRIPHTKMPLIPLSDGVGEVVECGANVSRFKPGDRVCPMFFPRWVSGKPESGVYEHALGGTEDGVLRQYMTLSENAASKVPAHLSDQQAASLPCAALTAWTALTSEGGVTAGDTVLLQGTGGVSIFGLQFAKLMGANTIITSSDDAKLEKAKALGADEVINYKTTPEWGAAVKKLTGGRGADRVLDVGGPATIAESVNAIAQNGRILIIGVLGGRAAELTLPLLMVKHVTLEAITVGHRASFEAMCRAMDLHETQPIVDSTYKADELGKALQAMATGEHFGKIALTL